MSNGAKKKRGPPAGPPMDGADRAGGPRPGDVRTACRHMHAADTLHMRAAGLGAYRHWSAVVGLGSGRERHGQARRGWRAPAGARRRRAAGALPRRDDVRSGHTAQHGARHVSLAWVRPWQADRQRLSPGSVSAEVVVGAARRQAPVRFGCTACVCVRRRHGPRSWQIKRRILAGALHGCICMQR